MREIFKAAAWFIAGVGASVGVGYVAWLHYHRTAGGGCYVYPAAIEWQVGDSAGNPIPGVELILFDRRTREPFSRPCGNWNGPGSIVSDGRGRLVLNIEEPITASIEIEHIGRYYIAPDIGFDARLMYKGKMISRLPLNDQFTESQYKVTFVGRFRQ
jgi:hypothetical protein